MTQPSETYTLGTHVLSRLKGCPSDLLERAETLDRILNEVVLESGLHKVGETYHQFKPFGATGVILLAESHISVHTWPERGERAKAKGNANHGTEQVRTRAAHP